MTERHLEKQLGLKYPPQVDSLENVGAWPQSAGFKFEFKDDKKQEFETYTRVSIGKRLAVFLDRRLLTAPLINDAIPGKGVIEGRFSLIEANMLASQLNSGPLPAPLVVVSPK